MEKKRLGDLLLDAKLITEQNLNEALRLQVGGNRRLGYLLIKMGFISEEHLHTVLSQQMDLPIVKIKEEFTPAVRKVLPRYLCHKYSVIPLSMGENNTLKMAMVDPSDDEAVSDIEKYTGKIVRPFLASKSDISTHIRLNIPWTIKDAFNAHTSTRLATGIATVALCLIVVTAIQFYKDRQYEQFGKVITNAKMIIYENLDLQIGFDDQNKVSLLGHGAYSSGNYSVTFNDTESLKRFLEAKKEDFSTRQLEWISWALKNPRGK